VFVLVVEVPESVTGVETSEPGWLTSGVLFATGSAGMGTTTFLPHAASRRIDRMKILKRDFMANAFGD